MFTKLQLAFVLIIIGLSACVPFGIYHQVQPGQTMYRIARTYDVPVDDLMEINRIDDPTKLYPGDLLYIPGATRQLEIPDVETAYKSSKSSTQHSSKPQAKSSTPISRKRIKQYSL